MRWWRVHGPGCSAHGATARKQSRSSAGAGAIGKAHAREEWERCESGQHAAQEVGSARAARGSGREPVPLELRRELGKLERRVRGGRQPAQGERRE